MPAAATAPQAVGLEVNGHLVAPALAGPNAWNMQSRNNFYFVSTILPGFICRNMPPGQENTLSNQECRDIALLHQQPSAGPRATARGRWSRCSSRC